MITNIDKNGNEIITMEDLNSAARLLGCKDIKDFLKKESDMAIKTGELLKNMFHELRNLECFG